MTQTRDDIVAAIHAAFSDKDLATILTVLDLYGTKPYECEKERVQLAIVELSQGSEDKLRYLLQTAKTDYRDVLAWQELGPMSEADGRKAQKEARDLFAKWGKK